MDDDQELHILHEAIFGKKLEETSDPDEIIDLLNGGKSDIIMGLYWDEDREEEYHEMHKIVLQKIEGDRVIFYNPLRPPKGTQIGEVIGGGEGEGPKRKIEATGVESISLEDFIKFFDEREGVCFLSE